MSKGRLLSRSLAHSPQLSRFFNPKTSRRNFFRSFYRFLTTYSPDNLEGLIDPNFNLPGSNKRVEPDLAEEYALLRDSLVDSGAECSPSESEMIDGLCKAGKTDEAYKLMLMMEEKGIHPNVVTYTAMIDGFGKTGKVNKSLELLRQMGIKGCAPNYVTYRVLISNCCAAGLLDEAHQLLEEMKQTYWPKHVASYHKVIQGFNRDFIINHGLLNEINETESVPVTPAYRILIDSFCKAGRLEVALELHREISSSSVFLSADRNVYSSLIESLSLSCKVDKAFELYVEMMRRGGVPDLSVFFYLIKGLIMVNRWQEALQLSDSVCNMDITWLPSQDIFEGS